MSSPQPPTASPADRRRFVMRFAKWGAVVVVLVFVGWRARELWVSSEEEIAATEWRWHWLLLAGVAYAAGWLPSVWFWQLLMQRLGGRLRYRDTARAYYCGHLGKYIPGKASVLAIRAALMKDRGFRPALAALTVAYETLVMMGTGLAIGLAAIPLLFPEFDPRRFPSGLRWLGKAIAWMTDHPVLLAAIVVLLCAAMLPVIARLFTRIAAKMTPRDILESQGPVRIKTWVLLTGVVAFSAAWALHGLSLGCVLQAVSSEPIPWENWGMWTATVALATSLGFAAVFAPGGVGVRELILMEALAAQGDVTLATAVVVPVFLRIVWFSTEIVVACALYYIVRPAVPKEE